MTSMTFKRFPYMHYGGDRRGPALEVELLGVNGKVVQTPALIDTGMEWTSIPYEMGVDLGAPLDQCKSTSSQTAGGETTSLWWNDTPEGLEREQPMVRAMGHEVPIAPMLIRGLEIVALGREDFLGSFRLEVDQRAAAFSLAPYHEPLDDWVKAVGGPDSTRSNA